MEEWLHIDKYSEAVSAIEMVAEQSKLLEVDEYRWKWFIIALHNALQCFMVLALHRLTPRKILRDDHVKYFENESNRKNFSFYKMDNFENLYLKIKNQAQRNNLIDNYFIPKNTDDWSVKTLNQIRNDFIHFIPCRLSRSIVNMIVIGSDCLDIIKYLCFLSERIHMEKSDFERTRIAVDIASSNINKLIVKYNIKIVKHKINDFSKKS